MSCVKEDTKPVLKVQGYVKVFTLVLLDMDSAEDLMDFYKSQFLGQLCRLSPNLLAKQVFVQRLVRHITSGDVTMGYIPDICRLTYKYKIGHFIDTFISTGRFPGNSAWGHILKTSVKRLNQRQRESHLDEPCETNISSSLKHSNSDIIWTALKKTPKYSKYCYNAIRILGYSVSKQFVSACKRCGHFSNSHVTHALWLCATSVTRRELICKLYDAMGGEKIRALIRSPLLTQCRQIALFSTQVENGMFVNAHLLITLHKLMYQNQ